jgi:WD40 repeat protein
MENSLNGLSKEEKLNIVTSSSVYKCTHEMSGHSHVILSLELKDKRLFSGSKDGSIRVWDLNKYTCVKTLSAHAGSVFALTTSENFLFSASSDSTIKVCAIDTNVSHNT